MTDEKPPLTSLPLPARRAFRAGPGRIWVSLRFPDLEARMVAIQTGDAALLDAFSTPDPWGVIQRWAGIPRDHVEVAFREWILSGGTDERLAAAFPFAQHRLAYTFAQGRDTGEVRLWKGRRRLIAHTASDRLTCSTREAPRPEARGRSACHSFTMEAAATVAKEVLLSLKDGIEDVIPGVDVLYYTVAEVDLGTHQAHLLPVTADGIEIPHVWRTGQSWADVCN